MIKRHEIDNHSVGAFKKLLDEYPDDATLIFEERLFLIPDPNAVQFANDLVYDEWTNEVIIIKGMSFSKLHMEKYHEE